MPLDGLSFSSAGLHRQITPAEIAAQAEQVAKTQAETIIKKLDESDEIKADLENDEEQGDLQGRDSSDKEEEENNSNFSEQEKRIKKYKVRFNSLIDMVELVDQKTGQVIETISPDDLVNLISKSKKSSGILVDREV